MSRCPCALGRNRVERADGTVDKLAGTDTVEVAAGDVFVIKTPGAGGYGPPGAAKADTGCTSSP